MRSPTTARPTMTPPLFVTVAAMLIASGCSHKPDARDDKIAKLEARLSEIESRYQALHTKVTNLVEIVVRMTDEDRLGLDKLMALTVTMDEKQKEAQRLFGEFQAALANRSAKQAAAPRPFAAPPQPMARANQGPTRDGVPLAIYNQIAADAISEWPGNYRMQVYSIKNQVEAYRKLYP